jgi:hypothetical protein
MDAAATAQALHQAIAADSPLDEVRAAVEACAPPAVSSSDERAILIAETVNRAAPGAGGDDGKTLLQAAHRLRRGDLVGLLIERGADMLRRFGEHADLIAVLIAYEQPESLRELLRQGHERDGRLAYDYNSEIGGSREGLRVDPDDLGKSVCSAAHFCVIHPAQLARRQRSAASPRLPARARRAPWRDTPRPRHARQLQLHPSRLTVSFCGLFGPRQRRRRAGPRPGERVNGPVDSAHGSPLHNFAAEASVGLLRKLLQHGADVGALDSGSRSTALMWALEMDWDHDPTGRQDYFCAWLELLRASPPEVRRQRDERDMSALNIVVATNPRAPCYLQIAVKLLRSGVPYLEKNTQHIVPVAAALMRQQDLTRQLVCDPWEQGQDWRRRHDKMLRMVFAQRHLQEEFDEREEKLRKIAELEAELGDQGEDEEEGQQDEKK